jgi:kumamolisin
MAAPSEGEGPQCFEAAPVRQLVRDQPAAGRTQRGRYSAAFGSLSKRRGAAALRALSLVVLVGAGTVVLRQSSVTLPSASPANAASSWSSPGTLIGPAREKSVSFLVLLRAAARPSCLMRWGSSARLSVKWTAGQHWAEISGAPRDVDRSFHVSIEDYRSASGSSVFATNHPAATPTGVCGEVAGVGSIHSFVQPTSLAVPQGGLSRVDLLRAYDALPLTSAGYNGQGQTIVLLEVGGFIAGDFNKFAAMEGLPGYNLSVVGSASTYSDETDMDVETVHEIAPQAHLVFLNILGINARSNAAVYADAFVFASKHWPGAVFSISLSQCETDTQAFNYSDLIALNSTVMSIEAKGSTVYASSGDSGGLDCTPWSQAGQPPESSFVGVGVPASLPAVTATGGTSLTTDAAGNYVFETTWSESFLSQGTGGGVSHYFPRPSWETGTGTGGQIDTGNHFEVPIVSADSDPNTGNAVILNGQASMGGGTSLASPIWAGFTAIMDQYLKAHHDRQVGFFNPILFHLANSPEPYPPFHDITIGGNDFYLATPGYDMTTGLGSPDVFNLARDLAAGRF